MYVCMFPPPGCPPRGARIDGLWLGAWTPAGVPTSACSLPAPSSVPPPPSPPSCRRRLRIRCGPGFGGMREDVCLRRRVRVLPAQHRPHVPRVWFVAVVNRGTESSSVDLGKTTRGPCRLCWLQVVPLPSLGSCAACCAASKPGGGGVLFHATRRAMRRRPRPASVAGRDVSPRLPLSHPHGWPGTPRSAV